MENEKKLEEFTETELKAIAYDLLVKSQQVQSTLDVVNKRIAELVNKKQEKTE